MRPLAALVLLAALCPAEDAVYLRRGGALRGTVTAENGEFVVLAMGSGEIRLPRAEVARVVRDVRDGEPAVPRVRRDEWFFLVRDGGLAGWARVLHTERGDRISVEERRVIFATREDRRRVEIATRGGRAREYLWIEARPGRMEVWSGQIEDGVHVRQHRAGGAIDTATAAWPQGARLPLVAWSRARFGERVEGGVLYDPRRNATQKLVVRHAPVADWAGETLPATAARVALAREVHAPPDPREAARESLLHPLTPRDPERTVHHLAGGFTLVAPHDRWVEEKRLATHGALLTLENRVTFARVEVSSEPRRDRPLSEHPLLRRSLTKLALRFDWFRPLGDADGPRRRVEIRRGDERWQGVVLVEKRPNHAFTLLALAPLRTWAVDKAGLSAILDSFDAVD